MFCVCVCACVYVCVCACMCVCVNVNTPFLITVSLLRVTSSNPPPSESVSIITTLSHYYRSPLFMPCRGNQLDTAGWVAVTDALECIKSLKSLNGCNQYAFIRNGGLAEIKLDKEWELGVWVTRYLERSSSTLTLLDIRCVDPTVETY